MGALHSQARPEDDMGNSTVTMMRVRGVGLHACRIVCLEYEDYWLRWIVLLCSDRLRGWLVLLCLTSSCHDVMYHLSHLVTGLMEDSNFIRQ